MDEASGLVETIESILVGGDKTRNSLISVDMLSAKAIISSLDNKNIGELFVGFFELDAPDDVEVVIKLFFLTIGETAKSGHIILSISIFVDLGNGKIAKAFGKTLKVGRWFIDPVGRKGFFSLSGSPKLVDFIQRVLMMGGVGVM